MIGPTRKHSAYDRYEIALGLFQNYGFSIAPPARMPSGFTSVDDRWGGAWHVKALPDMPGDSYLDVGEVLDTRISYPEPSYQYEYLIHLERAGALPRIVSFHKDPNKPDDLRYHWHDYISGRRRSPPVPIGYVSLRWFLEVAWVLLNDPNYSIPMLLEELPPPGPADPA